MVKSPTDIRQLLFPIIGGSKSFADAGLDFGLSLAGGTLNSRLISGVSPLNTALEKNLVEFSVGVPVTFTRK